VIGIETVTRSDRGVLSEIMEESVLWSREISDEGSWTEGSDDANEVPHAAEATDDLIAAYAEAAARHGVAREVESGFWVATVVGLDGAWSDGSTPEAALEDLEQVIREWAHVKCRLGAQDMPRIEGISLTSS